MRGLCFMFALLSLRAAAQTPAASDLTRHHVLVIPLVLRDDPLAAKYIQCTLAAGGGDALMQSVVGQKFYRARRLGGNVADRLHEAVLAIEDQLGHAANVCCDGSYTAGHGFESH